MTTLVFVLVWVILGLGLLFIALSGGPSGASQRLMSTSRAGRRVATLLFVLAVVLLGALVPAAVISAVKDKDDIPEANVSNLTEAEKHGRELFGQRCANCHTLQAANAIAAVGPNLDQLRPNKALVLDAIENGRARGNGQMAGGLYTGQDADDVASFVAKAVGQADQPGEASGGGEGPAGEESGGGEEPAGESGG
jgi:mono/diheme cytochrome c family protein